MSEDAQAPGARGNPAGGTPPRNPHAHDDVWAEPADSRAARAQPPQSPPRDVAPPEPTRVDLGSRGAPGPSGSAGATDPFALPEFDPPAPAPGAHPASGPPAAPPAPSVHDRRTVTSFPATGAPAAGPASPAARPWAEPSASPAPPAPAPPAGHGTAVPGPFAPPATGPVPPPPLAPGPGPGPGQVPYGYPGGPRGGYAHAAAQPPGHAGASGQGHYGWTGVPPRPANGMGVTGLVLGIISAVVFCVWPLAVGLGLLAVIFSALGRGKAARGEATNPGHALAGLICGWAGILLGACFGLLVLTTPYW
ncbi:DUF4190 domain-containing protein [Streptomyces prasinopilosus]|uniref:DUF4190 domain-containing protein n=2 Tax=Streptomyces prasinopilosus TaxID=67344 RepID=A0A1G7AE21_9ACTN|nr:DUF4190 domain-containing protein [Streptomyces prasinopilosus]SDE13010.1 hypothetical protein SAMN05216505_11818 [Streptomyces prasinopilosus]